MLVRMQAPLRETQPGGHNGPTDAETGPEIRTQVQFVPVPLPGPVLMLM
jgi:hypothetical protein